MEKENQNQESENEVDIMYEEHFAKEEVEEFEIDGAKFSYKPVSVGIELKWADEYTERVSDESGTYFKENQEKLAICKLKNLVGVPYDSETIKTILKLDNPEEWSKLNAQQRWNLLKKLRSSIFTKIIKQIDKINEPTKKKS